MVTPHFVHITLPWLYLHCGVFLTFFLALLKFSENLPFLIIV